MRSVTACFFAACARCDILTDMSESCANIRMKNCVQSAGLIARSFAQMKEGNDSSGDKKFDWLDVSRECIAQRSRSLTK
jgi:hypothetical protein